MTQLPEHMLNAVRRLVALELWRAEAVAVNAAKPFRLASGNYSPIYVDCRRLLSSVAFADLFAAAARLLVEHRELEFDLVAGGESAGIPFAAFAARAFNKPMIYVRKVAKAYGRGNRIEGVLRPGQSVLLVEDLITDAGSKLNFIDAVAEAGGKVADVLVVFDRLQGGQAVLATRGVRLHALADLDSVLEEGELAGVLPGDDMAVVKQYLLSPADWHRSRGLAFQG